MAAISFRTALWLLLAVALLSGQVAEAKRKGKKGKRPQKPSAQAIYENEWGDKRDQGPEAHSLAGTMVSKETGAAHLVYDGQDWLVMRQVLRVGACMHHMAVHELSQRTLVAHRDQTYGKIFFYNVGNKTTQWWDPRRPEHCESFSGSGRAMVCAAADRLPLLMLPAAGETGPDKDDL